MCLQGNLVEQLPFDFPHTGAAWAFEGQRCTMSATFRSSMTSSLNFLVTVMVTWCWSFDLSSRILR